MSWRSPVGPHHHKPESLAGNLSGGDGIKTGWTREAGRCFVGSATREGWQLVAVVLNAPRCGRMPWPAGLRFAAYNQEKLLYRGQVVRTAGVRNGIMEKVDVVVGDDYYYPLLPGEENLLNYRFEWTITRRRWRRSCWEAGDIPGRPVSGRVDLQAGHAVGRMPLGRRFYPCGWPFLPAEPAPTGRGERIGKLSVGRFYLPGNTGSRFQRPDQYRNASIFSAAERRSK